MAQRFEPQNSQGHYVPAWMNGSAKPVYKDAPTKPAVVGKARAAISNDSDSDLPYVGSFEETPTPRARSLIQKPLSDIGRSRRKVERRHRVKI